MECVNLDRVIAENRALALLPFSVAQRLNVLPLTLNKNVLEIAVADSADTCILEELRMLPQELRLRVAAKQELAEAIIFQYKFAEILHKTAGGDAKDFTALAADADKAAEELIDYILQKAVAAGASDIHFEPLPDFARVRCRIDGMLFDMLDFRTEWYAQIASRIKIMAEIDIAEKRHPQDGRIFCKFGNVPVDIRVSTLPTINGEKVVMRLLRQDESILDLAKLGFDDAQAEILKETVKLPNGLVIIAGPTGSGKSTTLHALMKLMNDEQTNLISIEDPVEYTLKGVNQVQVNEKIGLNFSNILRSVLRQDPDKIMVGEIRDLDTAELAVRAALTGHLVLTTLHADDAAGAVTRLLDMGIKPFLLASALKFVISQRLARLLCEDCKEYYTAAAEDLPQPLNAKETKLARSTGCGSCRQSGCKGRTVVAEMLAIDSELRAVLTSPQLKQQFAQYMKKHGIKSLRDSLVAKLAAREISLEEFYLLDSDR